MSPSPTKMGVDSFAFLEQIYSDIDGHVDPLCGQLRYFIVLIDASIQWSYVCYHQLVTYC